MTKQKHEHATRRKLKDLNIIDNFLFNELTSQSDPEDSKRFCKILIESLLGWKIGNVQLSPQKQVQGFDTDLHSICMDVLVEAETKKDGETLSDVKIGTDIYDIEPNTRKGKDAKRARYYTALIDGRILQSGAEYEDMKNVYLVIITPYDPFNQDSMIYTIKSRCMEIPDMPYNDGVTCIFLYTRGKKNIPGKKAADMLHFIENSTAANAAVNSDCRTIMDMVERIKVQGEVGIRYMKAIELEWMYREEGREEGHREGLIQGVISLGRKCHLPDDEILSELQVQMEISLQDAKEYLEEYDRNTAGEMRSK